MKTAALIVSLLCCFTLESFSDEKPVAGTSFILSYDPATAGILTESAQVWVVYVSDFWGTTAHQKLKGEEDGSELFTNVLAPDEGRTATVKMVRDGKLWRAEIPVPKSACLLSYYFTDSTRFDYNARKTYVSYVYDDDGVPVRDARLQNVDFLLMAGRDYTSVLEELHNETEQYPDNFIAHMVYWRFKFFTTTAPAVLETLASESDVYFTNLQRQFGDTVLNYQVRALSDINRIMRLSLSKQRDEPQVAALRKNINTKIIATIALIPPKKRIARLDQYDAQARAMLMTREEIEEQNRTAKAEMEKMAGEFIGQPAPDFVFKTLDGTSHKLSDFRGSYVLLDFWGTWCRPCVDEIPNLATTYDAFKKHGLVVISVGSDAMMGKPDPVKFEAFTKKKGMVWMQVLDDASGTLHKQYNIKFWPNVFLIDREGIVLQREGLRGAELTTTLSALPWK